MNNKDFKATQLAFGVAIFLFGTSFAYFLAQYLDKKGFVEYWPTLAITAVVYVIVAILLWAIPALSLGFLFASDILLLHLLFDNFNAWNDGGKALLLGVLLVVLYLAAHYRLRDPEIPEVPVPPVTA